VGVAIVALSVYQVTSVPQQNRQVEAGHNAQVREQLQGVRAAILETAATGRSLSALVTLGTDYPDRVVAVNPAPAAGTFETTAPGPTASVSITNATATVPETADYWNGSRRTFTTRAVAYSPNYNEFDNAPTTAYGHSLLYALYGSDPFGPDAAVRAGEALSNQTVIDDRRITIVTVDGSVSETGTGNYTLETRPVSVSNTTVPLTNATGEGVELTLSTEATNESWQRVLTTELVENGGSIESFECSAPDDEPCGTLSITLEPTTGDDPYLLRMAEIGVGSGASVPEPRYLTNVTDRRVRVPENASRRLVLEVRDRYNNPVDNESVNLTIVDRSVLERLGTDSEATVDVGELRTDDERGGEIEATTNENGRAVVRYLAPRSINGSGPRNATVLANRTARPDPTVEPGAANSTAFDVTIRNADASPVPHTVRWNRSAFESRPGVECGPNRCIYDRSAGRLTIPVVARAVSNNESVSGVDVALANRDPSVVRYVRADAVTNEGGTATATVEVRRPGTTTLAVAGGTNSVGAGDRLNLTIANRRPDAAGAYVPQNATSGTAVQFDARQSSDPDGRIVEYQWAFGDGSRKFGPRPQHVYNRSGTYNATLTVTDEHGATGTTTATVEIANRPPQAAFEYPLTVPRPGEAIMFDASNSVDPDGEIVRYEWDFGDGSEDVTTGLPTTSHAYEEPGTYVVSLRVTDDDGATDVIRKTVTVGEG
jgi:PKD repeat protein